MQLIRFLRYLSEKYFSRFELTDDSQYWESGDEDCCRKRFVKGAQAPDLLDLSIYDHKAKTEDTAEYYKNLKLLFENELEAPEEGLN